MPHIHLTILISEKLNSWIYICNRLIDVAHRRLASIKHFIIIKFCLLIRELFDTDYDDPTLDQPQYFFVPSVLRHWYLYYIVLYPQNGDRIVTIGSVTSLQYQGCRGDGISIPIPIPYPQKILWVSPQDPHTHRTPTSYILIPAPSFYYKTPILICCLSHWQFATTWCMFYAKVSVTDQRMD